MEIIPQKYAYLVGSLYFLAIWLILFWRWPNRRRYMLIVGAIFMWLGIFTEYFWWTKDWWQPATITGTKIGIEDFIMSFTHASIPILIYKLVFSKRLDRKFILNKRTFASALMKFFPLFFVSFVPTSILFYAFHLTSFTSTCIGMIFVGIFIAIRRPDLILAQIWTAFLMVLISLPVYLLGNVTSPGVIEAFWKLPGLATQKIVGVPVGDIVWYALLGFFLGGIIEYAFGYALVDEKFTSDQL